MPRSLLLSLLFHLLSTTLFATTPYFPPPESAGGWRTASSDAEIRQTGLDPQKLDQLKAWLLASDDRDFAAVVIKNGHIVLEVERGNSSKTDSRRVASVSKAVCATVLAIASEESQHGRTPKKMSFSDRAFDYIPWAHPLSDPRKAQITVKQLLNHTSGICPEALGAKNDGTWQYVLGHTGDPNTANLAFDPGTASGYSTHALAHAALVCENVTGQPYDQFAIQSLFKPLGCQYWWFQTYDGDEKHGKHPSHGLGMPARDLARIAYCMLKDGKWNDQQVIPRWFVREAAQPTHDLISPELRSSRGVGVSPARIRNADSFSHGWELPARITAEATKDGHSIPIDARFKPGSGGQLIAFVPSLDLVITRQTGGSGQWDYTGFLRRACACVLQPETPTFDPAKLEQVALDEMRDSRTPGAAIAIVRDGKTIWKKGLGLANVETQQPVTPDMLFRLGSTTKMFTAAAVVSLAEEGKLRMEEPIGKHITGLHPNIAALTPHQLLTHTAGLTDESIMSGRHDDEALAAYARTMDPSWLFTEPGKIHSYSNPGYWLAGLAGESITGQPYADLMHNRLFSPLRMTRTTLRPTLAMTWPLALGHEIKNGQPSIVRPQADNAATWPAGQIYSSIEDLAHFTTAFLDSGKLDGKQALSPSLIATLTSPYVPRPGDDGHYGYGLSISDERGVRIWQHGGSRTGYGSTIRMAMPLQDNVQKTALIILTNRSASSLPKTAAAALEMLLPFQPKPTAPEKTSEPLTEKQMQELAGTYTNNRQTIHLLIDNGHLIARRADPDSPALPSPTAPRHLTWSGENRLGLTSTDDVVRGSADPAPSSTTYTVIRDSSGRPQYLVTGSRALKRQP